jgi:prepilin-type N-terminal cleavage/methylation domain-containing protein
MDSFVRRLGFTLLEMMFTVAVISVLLMIAIPAISKAREKTSIEKAKADVEIIAAAVQQLAWDTGKWPGAIARNVDQNPEVWDLTQASAGLLAPHAGYGNWKGPYLPEIKPDPWGMPYFFDPDYTTGGKVRVVVGSFGPNRIGRNVYDSDNIFVILK